MLRQRPPSGVAHHMLGAVVRYPGDRSIRSETVASCNLEAGGLPLVSVYMSLVGVLVEAH